MVRLVYRWLWAWLVFWPPLLVCPRAHPAERIAVGVVCADQVLAEQIVAELSALGYRGVKIASPTKTAPHHLDPTAWAAEPLNALIDVGGTGISVWRVEKGRLVRLDTIPVSAPDAVPSGAVLQAVEVLRAYLMDGEWEQAHPENPGPADDPAPGPAPPSKVAAEPKPSPQGRLLVAGGAMGAWARGGLSPTIKLDGSVGLSVGRRVVLGVYGWVPLQAATADNAHGHAAVRDGAVMAAVQIYGPRFGRRLSAFGTLAAGMHVVRATGEVDPPAVGRTAVAINGIVWGRVGIALRLWSTVAITAYGALGVGVPRQVIDMGERIPLGNPLWAGGIGWEVFLL